MSVTVKSEWITASVSSTVAETLNAAAELTGATLNDFVAQAALEKAQKILDRANLVHVSRLDIGMLLDLLDAPPKPNPARRKAYERFMQEKYGIQNGTTENGE